MNKHNESDKIYDVIIVGAGPIGLSTAVSAHKNGLNYLGLEKGTLLNSLYQFPTNMTFFSTAPEIEIGDIPFICTHGKPNRLDALQYYRRVVEYFGLKFSYHSRVMNVIKRDNVFSLHTEQKERFQAKNVILATGYFDNPNTLDVPGANLPKVSYRYKESHFYYGKKVLVIGGGNSAIEAALEIYRSGGSVTMALRGESFHDKVKYWIRPDIENRIASGKIKGYFNCRLIDIKEKIVTIMPEDGKEIELENDYVLALIGFQPDTMLMDQVGVHVQKDTLVPEHDEKTLETNIPGLYIAGTLTVGKETNRVFIENGRYHGDVIMSDVASKLSKK